MILSFLRWLPLSLALHAAALGGVVWVIREVADRPLFVDLTLTESTARDTSPPPAPPTTGAAREPRERASGPPSRPSPGSTPAPAVPRNETAPIPARNETALAAPPPLRNETSPAPAPVLPTPPALMPAPVAPLHAPAPQPPPARAAEIEQPRVADSDAAAATPSSSDGPSIAAGVGDAAPAGAAEPGAGPAGTGSGAGTGGGDGPLALAVPGDAGAGGYGPYLALLRRRVQESLTYPTAARRRGLTGTVHLDITLESSGAIRSVTVVRTSSHALLDDAALEAVRGLGRVPFPPEVRPRTLRVRLPVVFDLR
jgi:protein TonB